MKITKVYVKRIDGMQRLLGTASIIFDDCLKIRDIFILPKNKSEIYISMPSKKIRDNFWISIAHPITDEFRQVIQNAVLDEYNRLVEAGLSDSDGLQDEAILEDASPAVTSNEEEPEEE